MTYTSSSTTTAPRRTSPHRERAGRPAPSRLGRLLLALAAVAVAFAAADTYVVVLALPDMMASRRHPGRAAPAGRADRLAASCSATSRCCR